MLAYNSSLVNFARKLSLGLLYSFQNNLSKCLKTAAVAMVIDIQISI